MATGAEPPRLRLTAERSTRAKSDDTLPARAWLSRRNFLLDQFPRDVCHETSAIARVVISGTCAAMFHAAKCCQGLHSEAALKLHQ